MTCDLCFAPAAVKLKFDTTFFSQVKYFFKLFIRYTYSCCLFFCQLFSSFKKAAKFFKEDPLLEDFTFWDYQEFVSLWFLLLMISDCLTIIGSVYKVAIDQRVSIQKEYEAGI